MGQDNVVIHLAQHQWLAQPRFAITRRGAALSNRRDPLAQAQLEPFATGRVPLPAAGGQAPIHCGLRATYPAVLDLDDAPPSHALDHLRLEQLGNRHPARLERGASGSGSAQVPKAP